MIVGSRIKGSVGIHGLSSHGGKGMFGFAFAVTWKDLDEIGRKHDALVDVSKWVAGDIDAR